tara:strand:+ start:313 stop:1065 length:753 start_codon:yes stop_codon:yes gene_type:complete
MIYKILKKLIEAMGFKLIEKNLVKNDRLISKYSFLNTEKFFEYLFTLNKINFIIQIGANDGVRFDVINGFIKKYKPKVIFLEPIKSNFEKLKKNYLGQENLLFENYAISVNNKINELFKVNENKLKIYDEHVIGITSFDKKHLIKHGINKKHIIKETVNTISITDLIKKHSIKNFDLLLIDTEGYDGEIVSEFLNKSNIRPIIVFEYIHVKNKILRNTLNIIKEKKYFFFKLEENIICYPFEKEPNFKFG